MTVQELIAQIEQTLAEHQAIIERQEQQILALEIRTTDLENKLEKLQRLLIGSAVDTSATAIAS